MEQIVQLTTTKLHKCQCSASRNKIIYVDRISSLPDDILATILSRLTMQEAARTTILSHRWNNLWTHTTGSLDFEALNFWLDELFWRRVFGKVEPKIEGPVLEDRVVFVSWVNRILKSHKGATIDSFKVHFDLDSSSRSDIDGWINFALQKRARRLELDLERLVKVKPQELIYLFPEKSVIGHPTINSLTYLKMNYVNVTRELLEYVLSNCPFLEFVCVRCSQTLVGAKVDAASPKLHYLEISHCNTVEFLEISSTINLRTLKYAGPRARLCFKNAPNLTNVSFGGEYVREIVYNFHQHSIPLPRIEKLKLDMTCLVWTIYDRFPNLKNLKELKLVITGWDPRGVLHYATLLEKCPMLYRLCVEFKYWFEHPEEIVIQEKECRLECLKFIDMFGFRGRRSDVELAAFLISNSPHLVKIIIDTRNPPEDVLQTENVAAKECATQLLSTKLSPDVEYVIL